MVFEKKGIKDDSKDLGTADWKNGISICQDRNDSGRHRFKPKGSNCVLVMLNLKYPLDIQMETVTRQLEIQVRNRGRLRNDRYI